MKKILWLITAGAFITLTPLFGTATIGKAAPLFTLTDAEGKAHRLSQYKGKIVVLEWVNLKCPFVRKFYNVKNMQTLQKRLRAKGIVWLSICSSAKGKQGHFTAAKIRDLLKKEGAAPTAYLIDESGQTGKAYGATNTPHMFVIDKQGLLAYKGAIDSIRSFNSADIKRADNYAAAAVTALIKGESVKVPETKAYGCSVKY